MLKGLKGFKERLLVRGMMGKMMAFSDGREHACNGYAVLEGPAGRKIIPLANIVTNDGDIYYATAAVGSPSWAVAGMRLGTGVTTPVKANTDVTTFLAGSGKAVDATYPKVPDDDADNTGDGADVVSWRVSYGTAEGNGTNIAELALVDNITTPTKALAHALFAATFTKTSSDTLKVFVNHTMNGV